MLNEQFGWLLSIEICGLIISYRFTIIATLYASRVSTETDRLNENIHCPASKEQEQERG